jgi:tetratricopeptide (TPR) repeat protein
VLSAVEKAKIVEGCYDLLLILSQTADPAAGLKILDRAARLLPEPTAAYHLRRAECLARLGDVAGREDEEERAGRRPAVTPLDHFLIGRERLIARRWEEAIESLEKAIEHDSSLTAAHHLLAIGFSQGQPKRLEEALSSINTCLRVHRDQVGLYLLRAHILGEQGNRLLGMAAERPAEAMALRRRAGAAFEAAERDYRTALDGQPNEDVRYVLLVNRGGMYLESGRPSDSLADLEAAIRLKSGPYEAYATLAQLHAKQGRLEESSRAFEQAIERAPDPAVRIMLHRSRARLHAGRRDATPEQRAEALLDLEEAIRLERGGRSQIADDHVERARLLFAGGQAEAALEACSAAIKLVPVPAGAHQLRISALMALKRFDEVLGSCDAYLSREEPTVEVLEIRGLARVARQDLSGAISDYTRAIELRPDLEPSVKARLLNRRGWAHHFADASRLALDDFESSLTLIADQAEAHAGRGLARVRLGDWKPAVADAEAAVRLAGTMPTGEGGADARLQVRFNAARIYAQATEFAAAEVGRRGERAVELYRAHRGRALDLLRQALEDAPAPERARLLSDPALRPLRLGRAAGVPQQVSR